MPEDSNGISDADLHAFVDDLLDPDRRTAVARALARDAGLADRVQAYRAQKARLHELFDGALDLTIPDSLLEVVRKPASGQENPLACDDRQGGSGKGR